MKVIVLYNNYPDFSLDKEELDVCVLPDTTLLKDGKPLFVPDFATTCCVQGHLVVRICRLGRSISERFAHRYYDAITVGATFSAENLRKELEVQLSKSCDGVTVKVKYRAIHPPLRCYTKKFGRRNWGKHTFSASGQ